MGLLFVLLIIMSLSSNPKPLAWLFTRSDNYLKAEGRIISSKISTGGVWGGWRFEIRYEYKIGSQTFTSDRVHFGYQSLREKSYAQAYIDKYFIGKKVTVFYDPSDPNKSVLEPQVKWHGFLYFLLLACLIPGVLFWLSIRFYRKSHSS
jgi:hypothetical protein